MVEWWEAMTIGEIACFEFETMLCLLARAVHYMRAYIVLSHPAGVAVNYWNVSMVYGKNAYNLKQKNGYNFKQ